MYLVEFKGCPKPKTNEKCLSLAGFKMRVLKVIAGTELKRKKACFSVCMKSAESSSEMLEQLWSASYCKVKKRA